jgi:RimJ/RimL family protein N-acetyltransferase
VTLRSIIRRTDIAALPVSCEVQRRDGYLVVRSPSNPGHYWGNLLLFDDAPGAGDGPRWEQRFDAEFAGCPGIDHRTFAWDRNDGELGAAREELLERGYTFEDTVGLEAGSDEIRPHPRESRDVVVRALDHAGSGDDALFDQVIHLQRLESLAAFDAPGQLEYGRARMADLRELFATRGGAWFVAIDPEIDRVVGSCGIVVVDDERGRYQTVDTITSHRGRGICSRLLVEAASIIHERHGTSRFVIGADPDYHAVKIYESLGFQPVERTAGAYLQPPEHRP